MPTKGTSTITARVKDETIAEVTQRAAKRGISINAWVNWAINQGLRKHRK